MSILGVFDNKKEERILAFAMLLVFLAFNVLLISSHLVFIQWERTEDFGRYLPKTSVCRAMIIGRGLPFFYESSFRNYSTPIISHNSLSTLLAQPLANKYSRHQFRCISYGDNHTFSAFYSVVFTYRILA